ncbi:MAG: hypothetical protein HZA82_05875 [Thaumarchaeota archaeon]|nr:hypothetical protein [Nitrososphaerota archaeon]
MSLEWVVTGIILLGGMAAGGISLWIKRRKDAQISDSFETGIQPDLAEPEKDDEK